MSDEPEFDDNVLENLVVRRMKSYRFSYWVFLLFALSFFIGSFVMASTVLALLALALTIGAIPYLIWARDEKDFLEWIWDMKGKRSL